MERRTFSPLGSSSRRIANELFILNSVVHKKSVVNVLTTFIALVIKLCRTKQGRRLGGSIVPGY